MIERRIGNAEVAGLIPVSGFGGHASKPRVCHRQFLRFAWSDPRVMILVLNKYICKFLFLCMKMRKIAILFLAGKSQNVLKKINWKLSYLFYPVSELLIFIAFPTMLVVSTPMSQRDEAVCPIQPT